MANNFWILRTHEDIDVYRCVDCNSMVKSLDHQCDDANSIFSEQELEYIKATS